MGLKGSDYGCFDDDKGCYIVIANTEAGQRFIDEVYSIETTLKHVISTHSKLAKSIDKSPYRNLFMETFNKKGLKYAVKKYTDKHLYFKLLRKFERKLKK